MFFVEQRPLFRWIALAALAFGCSSALALGCSSVADNDPSFWTPSNDPGGKQFGGFAQPAGGAGGDPSAGGFGGGAFGGSAGTSDFGGTSSFGGSTGSSGSTGFGGSLGTGGSAGPGGSSSGGAAGIPGAGGSGPSGGPCSIIFQVTTVTGRGRFAPKNIGAIWIMNPQNQFVKTLKVWAATRAVNLTKWNAATRGSRVDAVSGATISNHTSHQVSWDCRDLNKADVPPGQYQVFVEMTEDDSALFFNPQSKIFSFAFPKGNGPGTIAPPNQPNFTNMTLTVQ